MRLVKNFADNCAMCGLLFYRNKFHRLKYGSDLEPVDLIPPNFNEDGKGTVTLFCVVFPPVPVYVGR